MMHLVEEQRPMARQLEQALFSRVRATERALFMSKQLGFEQRFGNCRAINGNERLIGCRAGVMNPAGKKLFARPGFTDRRTVVRRAAATLLASFTASRNAGLSPMMFGKPNARASRAAPTSASVKASLRTA